MIAADTSSLSAYLEGERGEDVDAIEIALTETRLLLPPVVLSEMASSTRLGTRNLTILAALPLLPLQDGYWLRAGRMRAALRARRLKARLADALIAQSCLDAGLALITRDRDFRHYSRFGLRILP
jgi:predicted nucleic acid-binding protein